MRQQIVAQATKSRPIIKHRYPQNKLRSSALPSVALYRSLFLAVSTLQRIERLTPHLLKTAFLSRFIPQNYLFQLLLLLRETPHDWFR